MHYLLKFASIISALFLLSPLQPAPSNLIQNTPKSVNRKLRRLTVAIFQLTAAGKYVEAISQYRDAANKAEKAGELVYARKFLNNLGGCQIAIFQYREALRTLEHARAISENSGDRQFLEDINLNISSLFLQLNDIESAAAAAERGMTYLSPHTDLKNRAKLTFQLATIRSRQNDLPAAERLFAEGINAAYDAPDPSLAALGWEYLGSEYLAAGRIADADRVLTEAFRIRKSFQLPSLYAYWQLALVRAKQGDLASANILIDNAILALKEPGNITAPWNVYGARGRIRLLSENPEAALDDFRRARSIARTWRAGIIANDASRTAAESALSTNFYSSLIQAGNQLYVRTHKPSLQRETFEAVEENRAASLRALASKTSDWRSRLPAQYWQTLTQLQRAETLAMQHESPEATADAARIHTELNRLEALAGSPAATDDSTALVQAQQHLSSNAVFLSFHLGEPDSWLWAVTSHKFAMYRLPPKSKVAPAIRAFQVSVRENGADAATSGAELYKLLFASVSPGLLTHPRWLLALDDDLFNLPFAALVTKTHRGRPVYLAELHALQNAPGALMLGNAAPSSRRAQSFLGVGDPIYNQADARWHPGAERKTPLRLPDFSRTIVNASSSSSFARLWGSGQEIRSAAGVWNGPEVLLTGNDANKARLWEEVKKNPAIVHFATHILEAKEALNTGWIALTLNRDGQTEYIQPTEISARAFPGTLVVLSGCSSGSAQIRTASGLMGLTRAFMSAGAGSVLATRWATLDDGGSFFTSFYRYLHNNPASNPAEALRHAQLEAIRAGDWHARPSFWSSYFLTGNE